MSQHWIITDTPDRLYLNPHDLYFFSLSYHCSWKNQRPISSLANPQVEEQIKEQKRPCREYCSRGVCKIYSNDPNVSLGSTNHGRFDTRSEGSVGNIFISQSAFAEGKHFTIADINNDKGQMMANQILQELHNADLL